jgi:hypothetical protein
MTKRIRQGPELEGKGKAKERMKRCRKILTDREGII